MPEDPLSRAAVEAVDSDGVLAEILDLPEHLRDAQWRVESAGIRRFASTGLSVAVTDGLAAGIRALAAPRGDALLAISYTGDDAEVLAAFAAAQGPRFALTTGGALAAAARAAGAPVIPLPGGFLEPRLAAGYSLVAGQVLGWLGGVLEPPKVDAAADAVAALVGEWGPDAPAGSPAKVAGTQASDPPRVSDEPLTQAAAGLLWANLVELYRRVI